MDFTKLLADMEEIRDHWNGKESGLAEDRAMAALDTIESIKEIQENLLFLEEN